MFCKYCGTKATTAGFCTSCGQALPLPPATAQSAPPPSAAPAPQHPPQGYTTPAAPPINAATPAAQTTASPAAQPVGQMVTATASAHTHAGATTAPPKTPYRDPRKRGSGLRIFALVGVAILVLAGAGGAVWWLVSGGDDGDRSEVEATTYGTNAEWDALWDSCEAGELSACDNLYRQAPAGSDYETFGATCGEREGTAGACASGVTGGTVSDNGFGSDPELDLLWRECEEGSMFACDDLFFSSPPGTEYEEYGATCGGRGPGDGDCVSQFP